MEQRLMQKAITLAYENVLQKKGGPYGALVVKGSEIIGSGVNSEETSHDPTAHAEILAIREACRRLRRTDLSDCVVYASGEPCPMCLATIYWAGIKTVFYAYSRERGADGINADTIYKQLALPIEERTILMQRVNNVEPKKNPFKATPLP